MNFLEYWFLFPFSLLLTTVGMAVGLEVIGAVAPLLWLGLGLSPHIAIAVGLVTLVCTCMSAVLIYLPTRLIDYQISLRFLIAFIPGTIVGVILGVNSSDRFQMTILGASLFAVAVSFLRSPQKLDIVLMNQTIEQVYGGTRAETRLTTESGETISYTPSNWLDGLSIAAIAGMFLGLITNGLGELNGYFWVQRCRIPSQVAIATSLFVMMISAAIGVVGYGIALFYHKQALTPMIKAILFIIPGAFLGGQLGSIVAERLPLLKLERTVAGVLSVIGFWVLSRSFS